MRPGDGECVPVGLLERRRSAGPTESFLRQRTRARTQTIVQGPVSQRPSDLPGDCLGILLRHDQRGRFVLDYRSDAARQSGNQGSAAGQRFHHDIGKTVDVPRLIPH